jgi:hypothetical protein
MAQEPSIIFPSELVNLQLLFRGLKNYIFVMLIFRQTIQEEFILQLQIWFHIQNFTLFVT